MKWTLPEGYSGLIFDCDGTLVDSMPFHLHAWQTVLKRHHLEFPEKLFYEWAGIPTEDIILQLAADQGRKVNSAEIAKERDAYFHSIPSDQLRPVQAVLEIARYYRGKLPMAVATGSTFESASTSLRAIGIFDWFEGVFSSKDVGKPKPEPDVFLAAANHIQIDPKHCVAFEDADAGLQSARAAGMLAVDIRPWLNHK